MDKNTNLNAIIFKDDLCVHRLPSRQMPQVNRNSGLWIFNWASDFSSTSHSEDGMRYFEFYCIAHLLRGRGVYWTGDDPEPVEVEPGMCILMSPGKRHYYGAIPGGVFVEDTVNFWGPAADLLLKSGIFKDGVYRIGSVPVLRQVMDLAADPSEYSQLNAEFALREILQNIYNEKFSRGSSAAVDRGIAPLLEAVKNDKESKSRVRDYAIITLFLNCGMRVSELVGIDLNDVDRDLRSLTVTGKGNKQRIVYLNSACREALADYYAERTGEKHVATTSRALFLSNREQRISVKTVQWLVYKYLDMAGLESKHYSVHKLRHTAATLMYQTGNVDVRVLKDILGHEQLNTTQIYTHVSNRSMEEAMENNPLSSQKSLPHDNFTPLDKKENGEGEEKN